MIYTTQTKFPVGTLFLVKTVQRFMIVAWNETGNPNEPYTAKLLSPSGEINTVRASTLENHLRNHWPNVKVIYPENQQQ